MQFFFLGIYFEILELNFCNLNKNTRRNIKSRMNDDLIERKDTYDNCCEAADNYTFSILESLCEHDNQNIELIIIIYKYLIMYNKFSI